MGLLKILFVILLCAPIAYFCLRLIVQLIDQVVAKPKTKGRKRK
jgi:amino acid permease